MQRRILIFIAAAALAVGLAACGSSSKNSSSGSGTTAASSASAAPDTITAHDFALTSISVKAGATVTFKNDGPSTHTLTADAGEFDTGSVNAGSTKTFTAPTKAGTYKFHCSIHPSMTGTLTVT
jgi:plastocyanin